MPRWLRERPGDIRYIRCSCGRATKQPRSRGAPSFCQTVAPAIVPPHYPPRPPPHRDLRGGILHIARPLAPCGPWPEKPFSLRVADLFRRLLQQKPGQLHRLDRDLTLFSNLGRQLFQTRECRRCQRDQTTLGPIRVRGAAASRGRTETGFDVGQELQGAEIASRGRKLALAGGTECPGNLVHVQAPSHALHLLKLADGKILVTHHQSDLSLFRLTSQAATESAQLSQVGEVLNVFRGCVEVNQN